MKIAVQCPTCSVVIEADTTACGQRRECPGCHEEFEIPAAKVETGTVLGEFEVIRRIGQGGMGEVFLAEQLSMNRKVALKVLRPAMTTDKEAVERFLHEAKMSARLQHPGIVTVLDGGEDAGFYFIAMNYVKGQTLGDMVKRDGKIPEADALRYMMKVVAALDSAWRHHRVLHRDVKPSNIMVDQYGEVKLLDMGLAKDMIEDNSMTATGTILGTPFYMSPEQAKSQTDLDFRSDLYSVGATLFNLLAGRPPFTGDTHVNILTKHVLDKPPSVQLFNSEVSDATAELVRIMLGKEPEHRQPSYEVLLEQMEGALAGIVPQGDGFQDQVNLPEPHPATGEGLSRRKLFAGVAVLAVLFMALIVAALLPPRKVRPKTPPRDVGMNEIPIEPKVKPPVLDIKRTDPSKLLREELSQIRDFVGRNPRKLEKALARCRDLWQRAKGTPVREEITSYIKKLNGRDAALKLEAKNKIHTRVEYLLKARELEKAVAYLESYDGPYREHLGQFRRDLVRDIRANQKRATEKKREELHRQAELRAMKEREFKDSLDLARMRIAQHLLKQEFAKVRDLYSRLMLDNADNRAHREQVKSAFAGLDEVCKMDAIIDAAVKRSVKKMVQIKVQGRIADVRISDVKDGNITGVEVLGKGASRTHTFKARDILFADRIKLISPINTSAKKIMKALLYCEAESKGKALEVVADQKTPLVSSLVDAIGCDADYSWRRLLVLAELPKDEKDLQRLRQRFNNTDYPVAQRQAIRDAADNFILRFSGKEDASPYLAMVAAMSSGDVIGLPTGMKAVPAKKAEVDGFAAGSKEGVKLQFDYARKHKLPVEVVNSIGMRFRLVPPGAVWEHLATPPSKPYYIGVFEVTQAQWKKVIPRYSFASYDPDKPIQGIGHAQVMYFLACLSRNEGVDRKLYRLPTNLEWVYACRANTKAYSYFGSSINKLHLYANYYDKSAPTVHGGIQIPFTRDNAHTDGCPKSAVVGKFRPNPWGLYDMCGNVAEIIDSGNGSVFKDQIVKGGAWMLEGRYCYPKANFPISFFRKAFKGADVLLPVGFRVVRDIETVAN